MNEPRQAADSAALRDFLHRVWRDDVAPLLRDQREQRARAARRGGQLAASAGLALDGLLRLRGRPFTRMLTVLGARFGALLPDAWDWDWLRRFADPGQRSAVEARVAARASGLAEDEALRLLGVSEQASWEDVREAWRSFAQRWHPDKAPDAGARAEHRIRFVACQAAYERVRAAHEAGRLPRRGPGAAF